MNFYVNTDQKNPSYEVSHCLKKCKFLNLKKHSETVIFCIGSDRMTGDCLGPYVGRQLLPYQDSRRHVYGTLNNPIHACNLAKAQQWVSLHHPFALIIAVDAALGEKKHLGHIAVKNGPVYPGAGVRKSLSPVGDIAVTGVVGISGFLEQFSLQTARLSSVITLGDIIAQGSLDAFF